MSMATVKDNLLWMLTGSVILCLSATVQKFLIGAPLVPQGYFVPVLFGGVSGLICGVYVKSMKETRVLLERSNAALDQRIRERTEALENAMAEIKTLKGILPICSHCKRIRDGKGKWHPVDVYVCRHTHADFSHSICPECMRRHYPEYGDAETGQ